MNKDAAQLRVAVAKDVLERIVGDPNIEVTRGTYAKAKEGQLCKVCAIGGMVVSALENRRLKRKMSRGLTVRDITGGEVLFLREFERLANSVLDDVFDPNQLSMIEIAFEGGFEGCWGDRELQNEDGDSWSASTIYGYGSGDELDDEDGPNYDKMVAALRFSQRFAKDHDVEDENYERLLLGAIMKNIVEHGEFSPGKA